MSLKLTKDELELMSNKDITVLILEDSKKPINTAEIYKKIMKLLDLPESSFESKIADFYTSLSTDKRFILLDNGKWDLRSRYTSDKIIKVSSEDDEDEEEIEDETSSQMDEDDEDNYDDTEIDDYDDETNEELKDLVVIDEDELELEV